MPRTTTSCPPDLVLALRLWLGIAKRGSFLRVTLGWRTTPGVGRRARRLGRCKKEEIRRDLVPGAVTFRRAEQPGVETRTEAVMVEVGRDHMVACRRLRLPLGHRRQVAMVDEAELLAQVEDHPMEEAQVDISPEDNRQETMADRGRTVSKLMAVVVEIRCCRSCCVVWLACSRRRRSTSTGGRMQTERRVSK